MTSAKRVNLEGSFVVVRGKDGRIVAKTVPGANAKESWRAIARRMTNNGMDQLEKLISISKGEPHIVQLADGRESEPQVPTIEVQRQAAKDVFEFLHGKAVAQTEVAAAEREAQLMEQVRALDDTQLNKLVLEGMAERGLIDGEVVTDGTKDSEPEPAGD